MKSKIFSDFWKLFRIPESMLKNRKILKNQGKWQHRWFKPRISEREKLPIQNSAKVSSMCKKHLYYSRGVAEKCSGGNRNYIYALTETLKNIAMKKIIFLLIAASVPKHLRRLYNFQYDVMYVNSENIIPNYISVLVICIIKMPLILQYYISLSLTTIARQIIRHPLKFTAK